ncbi:MAG: mechanosensitive ion channel family protein [Candidatus Aminicenantia bacterium]
MKIFQVLRLEGIPLIIREIILSGLILLLFWLLAKLTIFLIGRLKDSMGKRYFMKKAVIKKIRKPIYFIFLLIGAYLVLRRLRFSSKSLEFIDAAAYVFIVLASVYLISKVFDLLLSWYQENVARKTETRIDDEFLPIISRIMKIAVYLIALMMILSHFGQNISALLAALGVGSLAIALASQEIIANMLAGFIIMVDRPFKLGDRIKLPSGELGEVEYIGLRNTKLKLTTDEDVLLVVPNLELMRSRIQNFIKKEI